MTRSRNRKITPEQLGKVRSLDDFDLVMLFSEVHDHGWDVAARTLEMMPAGVDEPAIDDANNERWIVELDALGKIMDREGLGFIEAVERLASERGLK